MQQEVIAYTGTDKALLDARQCIHGTVDVEQRSVVGIEIGADGGMNA